MGPFHSNLFLAVFGASIGLSASAQPLVGPQYETAFRQVFDTNGDPAASTCDATPIRPELDYSLRFQTGFTLGPLSQFSGTHHLGVIMLRITPDSGQPAYLVNRLKLPDVSETKRDDRVRATFVVAEGKYNVEMIFGDEHRQLCRSQWRIDARSNAWSNKSDGGKSTLHAAESPSNPGRLTILMHVAPSSLRSAKLPASDAEKLVGSLSALLDQSHARSARLVVFDLEQQKVLFRKDGFVAPDIQGVAKVIDQAQFGAVDYSTFANPAGATGLLTQLTEEERSQLHASDALVFLGLHMQVQGSIRSGTMKKLQDGPRIFYLECEPPRLIVRAGSDSDRRFLAESSWSSFQPTESDATYSDRVSLTDQSGTIPSFSPDEDPDLIQKLVKRLKGEIIPMRTPIDCARAIRRIAIPGRQ